MRIYMRVKHDKQTHLRVYNNSTYTNIPDRYYNRLQRLI